MKKSNAFTLAETIMTLFIVGLVVTAAIPMFTMKTNTDNVVNTPWDFCDNQGSIVRGLCGVIYPERDGNKDVSDNASVVIGDNNGNDEYKNYDLSVYEVSDDDTIYDMFQSDKRSFRVRNYSLIEDRTNLYMAQQNDISDDIITGVANNNIVIGGLASRPNGVLGVNDNVFISNNTTVANNTQNTISIGSSNSVGGTNKILFGSNLISSGGEKGIMIGDNINIGNASNVVHIGFPNQNQGAGNWENQELNINNMMYGNHTNGLSFYTDTELQGILRAGTLTATSDERLKNIKGSYKKGLKEVLQVEPVVFKYKGQNTRNIGVIAQELQKIFPEAVVTMPDGYLGVNTDPVFFAMFNAMKEVNQTTDTELQRQEKLQKELKELQNELETLSACKKDDFWSKIRCFFYDTKMWIKSVISNNIGEDNYENV